ncbi:hypothetical protein NDU88_004281 [Pleurodeles waltl]|uniref:Uncharacterized protein n=1 Tax=Pleurodeles waltl TaxID=8319 RepID=A0AAV7T8X5_PLEWA|nr:hypothetical protein NDU88_004281 [Pleurodeles waltl]
MIVTITIQEEPPTVLPASAPVFGDGDTRIPGPSSQCPQGTTESGTLTSQGVRADVMREETPGEGSRREDRGETEADRRSGEKASNRGKRQGEGQCKEVERRMSPSL